MGRRSQRLAGAEAATRTPSPEAEVVPVTKEKKKKKKNHKKPDKENRVKAAEDVVTDPVFTRRREDGSTSLAILTPGEGVVPGTERDRPVALGNYLGKVRYGAASIQGFKEDRRNQAKPMYPIFYPGGYSSHGPTYDSTFANLTPQDSKMVAPYFDFRKLENEDLIQNVCGEDYSEHFVDHLLDLLDGKDIVESVVPSDKKMTQMDEEINFDYLSTLEAEGIDMSFLSNLQAHYELKQEPEMADLSITDQLELTAQLIKNLATAQHARISAPPPANLNALSPPSSREMALASRLVTGLTRLTGAATPGELTSSSGAEVRRAMGVVVTPASSSSGLTNGHAEVDLMETS